MVPMEEYETMKTNFVEARNQIEELELKIRDLEVQIKSKDDRPQKKGLNLSSTKVLADLSSIMFKNESSFLSDYNPQKDNSIVKEKNESVEEDESVDTSIRYSKVKGVTYREDLLNVDFEA